MFMKKDKMVEYDQNYNYVRSYASASDARREHYGATSTMPFWDRHDTIHFLSNGNYLTKGHPGRDYLKKEIAKLNDPLRIKKRGKINERQVEVYNLSGDLVATFANSYIAGVMLNIDPATIQYRCKHNSKEYHDSNKFHFKFK